jgi:hypothetical protein
MANVVCSKCMSGDSFSSRVKVNGIGERACKEENVERIIRFDCRKLTSTEIGVVT